MVILLDAMGGDNAPDATIKGAVKAIDQIKAKLILIGNDNVVKFMIQNADTKIRNTGLEYKLKMIS